MKMRLVDRLMKKKFRIGKKAMDFPTLMKIIFIILLLLILIYAGYKMGKWLLGSGAEQTESALTFGS